MTTPTDAFNEWLFGSDGCPPNARHPSLVKLIRMGWDANAKHEQDMRAINHKTVYICEDHDSLCPIGDAASVILARDKEQAYRLLDEALEDSALKSHADKPYTLELLEMRVSNAHVLTGVNHSCPT